MPVMLFSYIYIVFMYIRQCPDNTRVGANCNSPFHMGAIENMGDLQWGQFVTWVICNMGNLQWGRIAIWANCNSPLRRTQKNPYHARDAFFVYLHAYLQVFTHIYMYICERPDNTRVGANCNSPFHMGAIENMGDLQWGRICNMGDL